MSQSHSRDITNYWRLIPLLVVWAILLGAGFWRLLVYSNTAGAPASPRLRWPTETALSRDANLSALVIFAHPRCPCSEATVGEFERLMPRIQGKVKSFVVFFKPKSKSIDWATKEALWKKAQSIPGVQVILDEGGTEAIKFGAKTSGQTFLYDPEGNLVFRGGITPERGHMGDSDGRNSILQFVATGTTTRLFTAVFGCSLHNPERAIAGDSK